MAVDLEKMARLYAAAFEWFVKHSELPENTGPEWIGVFARLTVDALALAHPELAEEIVQQLTAGLAADVQKRRQQFADGRESATRAAQLLKMTVPAGQKVM